MQSKGLSRLCQHHLANFLLSQPFPPPDLCRAIPAHLFPASSTNTWVSRLPWLALESLASPSFFHRRQQLCHTSVLSINVYKPAFYWIPMGSKDTHRLTMQCIHQLNMNFWVWAYISMAFVEHGLCPLRGAGPGQSWPGSAFGQIA